jgi:hypothetical protein
MGKGNTPEQDEAIAGTLAALRAQRDPANATASEKIAGRRRRVLEYRYGTGLSEGAIAALEGVDISTVSRDLKWWRLKVAREKHTADELIADLETRFGTIYDGAMRDVVMVDQSTPAAWRDRARARMVALAASIWMYRLRDGTGKISPMHDPSVGAPSTAGEIRRLADEVRRITGKPIDDASLIDLTAPGEREFLDGETLGETTEGDAHDIDNPDGDVR